MKRILPIAALALFTLASLALSSAPASAGLFDKKATPSPTASPTPLPMPTATPEPPEIAIPRLEAKLKTNPNDRDAMLALAQQFMGINHADAALTLTQRLLQLGTKTAQVYFMDASAQDALGNLPAATSDLESASNLEPTNLAVLSSLAAIYVKDRRLPDAERVANRAVTFNKSDPEAYESLASVYAAEQKWDQARSVLEQAYALNPKDVTPLMQEAQTWVDQNTLPNAIPVVDRALAADPKNLQVLIFRADLYAKQGDVPKAASAYDDAEAAATNDSDRTAVLTRKALMYAAAKQPAQAQAVFESAIKQYPQNASLHVAFGEYYGQSRDLNDAQQQLLQALQIDKGNVNALYDMAQLKGEQHRPLDAIGYLRQLASVAPSAQTFALLGQAYISVHDYGHAKDACERSFEINRTPDTLGCIGGTDFSMKNYKEAGQVFDVLDSQAKDYMNANPQMLYMMAYTYGELHQKSKAVDGYKRLLKMLKPGSSQYKQIQGRISQLNKMQDRKAPAKHASHR